MSKSFSDTMNVDVKNFIVNNQNIDNETKFLKL